jgi:ClpP class serine protease
MEDDSEAKREAGIRDIEIVSSQSPFKNLDATTDEGRAALQLVVNDLASVYGGAIARYRALGDADVFERYGAGRMIVGEKALAAGLIDEIAYTEDFHKALVEEFRSTGPRPRAVRSNADASAAAAKPQQETTMKYKKGAKVRVAAGGASVVADGTEGTVEEVRASAGLYRVAVAGGKSVLLAEDQVTEPETDEEKKAREAADAKAKEDGAENDEELDENGEPKAKAKPKAEGEDDEELDENGQPKEKPAAALSPTQLAAKAERSRVLGIQALAQAGEEAVVQECIDDPNCSVEAAALKLRQAQSSKPSARLAALKRADGTMPKAGVGAPLTTEKKPSPGAARVIAAIGRVFPQAQKS